MNPSASEQFYNYRDYLKNYLKAAKTKNPKFSIGAWSKKIGLPSTAALSKVLSGERDIGPKMVDKLITYFKFSKQEELSFRALISISKMNISDEDKNYIYKKINTQSKHRKLKSRQIALDQFNLLKSCMPFAIYELCKLPNMDQETLHLKLADYKPSEINEYIRILNRLQLIQILPNKTITAKKFYLETTDEVPSEAIKHYHKENLQMAVKKIDTTPVELREFQSLLFLLNTKNLPKYKEMIRDFINTLETAVESPTVDQLYNFQLQLYPVSNAFSSVTYSCKD